VTCAICDTEARYSWTDTHGVAQCSKCGTPYRIYHYEESARVERDPEICILPEYIPVLRAYWQSERRVIPGGHSFPGGYELAKDDDVRAFNEWMTANAQRILDADEKELQP
jgi:hypothetical protein